MIYIFCRMIIRLVYYSIFRLKVIGIENIPHGVPVILCSNHISNLDPPSIGLALDRRVYFMAKEELFRIPLFGWLIHQLGAFPVKRGGVSKESIRLALRMLSEGKILGIFPEGTRKNRGGIGKKGAASLALKANAVVVPVAIIGNYAPFRKMVVIYGTPVDLSEFAEASADHLERATDKIMTTIRGQIADYENAQ